MAWNRLETQMSRATAVSSVGGTDVIPVVQSGSSKKATIAQTRASPTFTGTVTLPATIAIGTLTDYADDAAAATGGLAVGRLYRTGSIIKVRVA